MTQVDPFSELEHRGDDAAATRRSPAWLLGLSVVSLLAGVALLPGGLIAHIVGYVLACLVPFTLVALFRRRSVERLNDAGVPASRTTNLFAVAILGAGFVCSLVHAWFIALHLSS